MNQHQRITAEMARQYGFMADAVLVSPSGLAHRVFENFASGEEEPQIQYASLEHIKHMARVFLARQKSPDSDDNPAYAAQGSLGLDDPAFRGLQDRYPIPRQAGEEAVYKRREDLTEDERAWNVDQLRKGARARLEHADALEAEGQLRAAS